MISASAPGKVLASAQMLLLVTIALYLCIDSFFFLQKAFLNFTARDMGFSLKDLEIRRKRGSNNIPSQSP